jgi:hypothetical protein
MDEPQPTQNLFQAHEDQTQLLGHAGPLPDYGVPPTREYYAGAPAPQWPVPLWRRRGALIGAGLLVLVVAGLVVGIVIAVPSSPSSVANAAAAASATSAAPTAAKGRTKGAARLPAGESLVLGTVSSVGNGQLVVAPNKGGNPVTVTTDGTTRFAGGATSVTDLRPGERVQLIVRNGAAVTIRAREAPAGG